MAVSLDKNSGSARAHGGHEAFPNLTGQVHVTLPFFQFSSALFYPSFYLLPSFPDPSFLILSPLQHSLYNVDPFRAAQVFSADMRADGCRHTPCLQANPTICAHRVEVHALKLPRDSGGTPLSEDRAASTSGSLASFTGNSGDQLPHRLASRVGCLPRGYEKLPLGYIN